MYLPFLHVAGYVDLGQGVFTKLDMSGSIIGQELRLSSEAAHFELSLVPLLRGEFQILQADLDGPILSVEADSSGAITPPALGMDKLQKIQLNNLVIHNGTVAFNDPARQSRQALTDLSFTGSADSLFGPFKGHGEFKRDGRPITYRFSTGAAEADRLRLKLILAMPDEVSRADFDGALIARRADARWRIGFEGAAAFSGRTI